MEVSFVVDKSKHESVRVKGRLSQFQSIDRDLYGSCLQAYRQLQLVPMQCPGGLDRMLGFHSHISGLELRANSGRLSMRVQVMPGGKTILLFESQGKM